jgi:elongation factor G
MTERMLFYSGVIHKIGEVHEGNTITDWMEQERERGITITAAATKCTWTLDDETYDLNIIDTPGHVDFTAEVNRSLRVLDGLVFLFSAVDGVEPQSETNWRLADNYRVPRIAFVNKMDRPGADFFRVLEEIKTKLGARAVPLQIPVGEEEHFQGVIDLVTQQALLWTENAHGEVDTFAAGPIPAELQAQASEYRLRLLEDVAVYDDALLETWLDNPAAVTVADIRRALRAAVCAGGITPVLCGSAYKNKGVQPCLDAVCYYLPSPADLDAVKGIHPKTEAPVSRRPSAEDPFCALIFKIATDPHVGHLCFIRVYSGKLEAGAQVLNARTGKKERITRLYQMHANKQNAIALVEAGDIAAVVGLTDMRTGDTLCAPEYPIALESMVFPEPVVSLAIEPKTQHDLDNLEHALAKLEEEDPTFRVAFNKETNQTVVSGMGELHLEILLERLKREFHVAVNQGKPRVNYKEALTQTVRHRERLEHQRGGPGGVNLFAEIEFELGPADEKFLESEAFKSGKQRLQFEWAIGKDEIDKIYLQPIMTGFASMLNSGPLAGYSLEPVKVKVLGGAMRSGDSRPLAFELCAKYGFRAAAPLCAPQLLEPVMKLEVLTPAEYLGPVLGDLNRRRGLPQGQESRSGDAIALRAEVPLAEMFGYMTTLRTMSAGRAVANLEFSHYAPASEKVKM